MSLNVATASDPTHSRWKHAEDVLATDQGLRGSLEHLLQRATGWDDDAESRPVVLAARRALARRTNPRLLGYRRQLLNALSNIGAAPRRLPRELEEILVTVEGEAARFRDEVGAAKQDVDCAQRVAAEIDRIRVELSVTCTNRARGFVLVAPAIAEGFLTFDAARERRQMESVKRMSDSIRLRTDTVRRRLESLGSPGDPGLRRVWDKLHAIEHMQRDLERLRLMGAANALSRIATLNRGLNALVKDVMPKLAASLQQTLSRACEDGWDNALARVECTLAPGSIEVPPKARDIVENLKQWQVPTSSEAEVLPTLEVLQWLIPSLWKQTAIPYAAPPRSGDVD